MKSADEIKRESDRRAVALAEAIRELEEVKTRYAALTELEPVFEALKTVKLRRPRNAKARQQEPPS